MPEAEVSRTIWEKLGAAEGLWAAVLLAVQSVLLLRVEALPSLPETEFVAALQGERLAWEWMTLLRIVAGLMIVWWMGSLAARLRLAEGEPGRLATIAFGVGAVWGALWLVSAFFNSATILLAFDHGNPAGARLAGALALETMYVLTPGVLVALTFAVALVGLRFGGFPSWYARGTLATSGAFLVLAVADWYGTGALSEAILALALAWTALTSVLLMQTYRAPDPVLGNPRAERTG